MHFEIISDIEEVETIAIGGKFRHIMRLIENLCQGMAAVGYLTESMHGAGSP